MTQEQPLHDYKGPERRRNGGGKGDQFIVVRSWQTFLMIIAMVTSAIVCYANLRAAADESTRRIQTLEEKVLTRDVYGVEHDAIEIRLKRIEDKLDAQDVRSYARDAASKKARD